MNVLLAGLAVGVGVAGEDTAVRQYGQYAVPALAVGGNVVMLSYGRNEELEADKLGIQYMVANGYDPKGQRQVMEVLGAASAGGARPPEWLSTHPASDTRISRINEMLKGEYAYTQGTSEFGLYPERYQRRMLARLADLPPAAHGSESAMIDLDQPMLWCAHCAEDAKLAAK
jgi:predicted Zn-dependent protease